MPRATEETEWIEIADFSPGIHSDQHGRTAAEVLVGSLPAGNLFANGVARAQGTERCHADKTGALVPLPRAQVAGGSGIRDFVVPHPSQFDAGDEPYRYVLDANLAPLLVDGTETEPFPWTAVFNTVGRAPIHITWAAYTSTAAPFELWQIVTRAYHNWHHLVGGNLYDPATTALVDQTVWEDVVVGIVNGTFSIALPCGNLCNTRFYYGLSTFAFGNTPYTVVAGTDVFDGFQSFENDQQVIVTVAVGTAGITSGNTYWVRDSSGTTFKLSATQGGAAINITSDGSGNIRRVQDFDFRPLWLYPVVVSVLATDWVRWGDGNRFRDTLAVSASAILTASIMGLAPVPLDVGGSTATGSNTMWAPAIGLKGQGTAIIGMSLQDSSRLAQPFNTLYPFRWLFHYSERGNVPQNDVIDDIAGGPINPYLMEPHQGRIVMADRRRTPPSVAEVDDTTAFANRGYQDDLLFYSDYGLPLQNYAAAVNPDKGVANTATLGWQAATFERYNTLLVAEDALSDTGAMGSITIDQFLVVKQNGGGALIQGDLDQPTILRLPFIKSTGGTICHGALTPVGFVYGTDDGVYAFQGGETSVDLSPQLDGDFWNHDPALTYAGPRGRFAFWESYIAAPNNYVYDVDTQSWWRFGVQTLAPLEDTEVPYSAYIVGNARTRNKPSTMLAFPYKHRADPQSHVTFPTDTTGSVLSVSDPFGALTELDVRFVVRVDEDTAAATRTIVGQWGAAGNRAWRVGMTSTGALFLDTSGNGTTVTTATCDANANWVGNPTRPGSYMMGRVTWRASDGLTQFFTKVPGDIYGRIQNTAAPAAVLSTSWRQIGVDKTAVNATLFNSTADFTIGNDSSAAQLDDTEIYAVWIEDTIDGEAPLFELYPQDFPDDPDGTATSFVTESAHIVNITRGTTPLVITFNDISTTPPVAYQFDRVVLDDEYRWASHPLIASQDRLMSYQIIEVVASYGGQNPLSVPAADANSFVDITLTGYDEQGNQVSSPMVSLRLTESRAPQKLTGDFANFIAYNVTVSIHAHDDDDSGFAPCWAPKVHSLRIATRPRSSIPRHS